MSSYADMLQELPPSGGQNVTRPPASSEELEMGKQIDDLSLIFQYNSFSV